MIFEHKIYRGSVFHERRSPKPHLFTYPSTFFRFNLSQLDSLNTNCTFFGYNKPNIIGLRDKDYLRGKNLSIYVQALEFFSPLASEDQILLFTSPRYLGFAFNPVNFYLRINQKLEIKEALVEVNNTFGDRHVYPLKHLTKNADGFYKASCNKDFHVSPFNPMEGYYEFKFQIDTESIFLGVDLYEKNQCKMKTYLKGKANSLNENKIIRYCFFHPFDTALNSMPRILIQAILILFKRNLPIYKRPEPISEKTIINNTKKKGSSALF